MKIPLHSFSLPRFDPFQALRRHGFESASTSASSRSNGGKDQDQSNTAPAKAHQGIVEGYVNQRVRGALDGLGANPSKPAAQTGFEDYSPGAVSTRILDYVEKRLDTVADPEQRTALLDKARQGIAQGFADARDVLKGMGLLQGQVAANIDDTQQRIMDGLDKLGPTASATDPATRPADPAPTPSDPAAASAGQAVAASFTQVETGSLSLSIQTADGDKITLSFQREQGSSATAYATRGSGNSSSGASFIEYQSSSLSFSVEGNLDDGEKKAIASLVKDVEHLANRFFDGNVQAAFKQASRLGFDNQQLASFSLDLNHTVESRAVAAYQAVAGDSSSLADTPSASTTPVAGDSNVSSAASSSAPAAGTAWISDAVDATADLGKLYRKADQSGLFAKPMHAMYDLFAKVSDAKGYLQSGDDEALKRVHQLLEQFAVQDRPAD